LTVSPLVFSNSGISLISEPNEPRAADRRGFYAGEDRARAKTTARLSIAADTDMRLHYVGACACAEAFHGLCGSDGVPSARIGARRLLVPSSASWQSAHMSGVGRVGTRVTSPRCGSMWSAMVAGVARPASRQNRHSGSTQSLCARWRCQLAEVYHRWMCGGRGTTH
jgi:hypothetical protein